MKNPRKSLSPIARASVRSVIVRSPGWQAYAAQHNINSAVLSGPLLYDVADALGVAVAATVNAANAATRAKASGVFNNLGKASPDLPAPSATGSAPVDWQRVRQIARDEAANAIRPVIRDVVVTINAATGAKKTLGDAPTHPQFARLAQAAACRDYAGNHLSIFLVGPTGTGKSYACRQLAQLLDLPFYFQSQASEGFDLVGYERINGVQKVTPFVASFRDGGICLLDECDRYEPKAFVALNSALANGEITLDNGDVVKRHKNFVCIGSGNTFGFGASADFTAAEKMDLSSISRFPVRLDWYIDTATEDAISAAFADDADLARHWLRECRLARAAMERLGLPFLADQRCVEAGANMLAAGMPVADVRAITYLASLDADQQKAVKSHIASNGIAL